MHFFHCKKDDFTIPKDKERFTIAYEPIKLTLQDLFHDLEHKTDLTVMMGRANCHYKDQFSKKIGRELATSRVDQYLFELQNVQSLPDRVIAQYTRKMALDENGGIVDQNKKAVHYIWITIYRDSGSCRVKFGHVY
jgi:hypothetical protein